MLSVGFDCVWEWEGAGGRRRGGGGVFQSVLQLDNTYLEKASMYVAHVDSFPYPVPSARHSINNDSQWDG